MSLTQALATAMSGLRVTQTGLSIVASNVANAETPGYVRKVVSQVTTAGGNAADSVRIDAINRALDQYVQRQLQTETSGGAYADMRAQFYQRLQVIYGAPASDASLDTIYGKFTTALQALSTSPDSASARSGVLSAAQALAQQLRGMTSDIQGLRTDAEQGIGVAVSQANEALQQIARINRQLATSNSVDAAAADLLDKRDAYISQLSQLMDIRVIPGNNNQISVFTGSGMQLVGNEASTLSFDGGAAVAATSQWSADPAKRSLGTITLTSPTGGSVDLIANNAFRSGEIAALLEMRDQILPQAQGQLDQIAAGMARALSDKTTDGAAVTLGAQSGFDFDIGALANGNTISVTYTDQLSGAQHSVTIVRVDDPSALPLSDTATANPNDRVVGVDFSGGPAAVAAQLNSALGVTGLQFSNPSGTTLRVLDDGAGNRVTIDAASTTSTAMGLTDGGAELPFFIDATAPYTGAITSLGPESVGFAGRITVNPALIADPSRLVVYQTLPLTDAGDTTRPDFLYDRLTNATLTFAPQAGIGTASAPFGGSILAYLQQMISRQGQAADAADSIKQGQDIVVNALQQRFNDTSGVNMDQEMANLLSLQTAYAANARVMSTVRDLLDDLLHM